jgi:hypothetical protein
MRMQKITNKLYKKYVDINVMVTKSSYTLMRIDTFGQDND